MRRRLNEVKHLQSSQHPYPTKIASRVFRLKADAFPATRLVACCLLVYEPCVHAVQNTRKQSVASLVRDLRDGEHEIAFTLLLLGELLLECRECAKTAATPFLETCPVKGANDCGHFMT